MNRKKATINPNEGIDRTMLEYIYVRAPLSDRCVMSETKSESGRKRTEKTFQVMQRRKNNKKNKILEGSMENWTKKTIEGICFFHTSQFK
jgi:hypothetical protein